MRFAVFSAQAKRDLVSIAQYIAGENGSRIVARQFIREIRNRCDRLARYQATLGHSRDDLAPGLRSLPHKSYIIFFRYLDDAVEISTVLHARRDIETMFDDD